MLCQRCPQLREELQRTRDNVRLIEDLLRDARNREKTQDTLDRLAMLHKHCRTNYKDMANLTFALNHCQNQPRCPGQWYPTPSKNFELSHGWHKSRTPPSAVPSSNDMWQESVAGLQVWRKWHYQEMTMSCGRTRGSWPVARCLIAYLLISGWYNIFSLLNILNKLNVVVK